MNNRRAKASLKTYTSHFIVIFACERELETKQNCNILTPPFLWPSALCLSPSPDTQPEARGPTLLAFSTTSYQQLVWSPNSIGGPEGPFCWVVAFPTTTCLQLVWSPTRLISNSSSPSYIIVQSPTQSPTQSLEKHVWSSSSGNNCLAAQRSLSSGASVYECIMGFFLVPFRQPNPPTRFLLITGHWNVSLPSGASLWNGMFGRVEGPYTTIIDLINNNKKITESFKFTKSQER